MQTIEIVAAVIFLLVGAAVSFSGIQDVRIAAACIAVGMVLGLSAFTTWGSPAGWELIRRGLLSICITGSVVLAAWPCVARQYAKELAERQSRQFAGVIEPLFATDRADGSSIEIGNSGAVLVWTGPAGRPMFRIFADSHLTVERINGRVVVSTRIRDASGALVAELARNEWKVAPPPGTFDRNFTRDSLEVRDRTGDIVLQVRALGNRVQLQGKWYDEAGNFAAFHVGGAMSIYPASNQQGIKSVSIRPMFKYPSERHMGELTE